jgi:hypothetical protein
LQTFPPGALLVVGFACFALKKNLNRKAREGFRKARRGNSIPA